MTEQIKKILPDIQDHYVFKDYAFKLIGGTALPKFKNQGKSSIF